jgi:uncharacterized tellurite resistance protein B-like protein
MNPDYQFGLLYLLHLLIQADGVDHEKEIEALDMIKEREVIPQNILEAFAETVSTKTEQEIYCLAADLISRCSREEKINVFAILYKMSEVDGRVHVKEIKLLLYSLHDAGITFNDVVNHAHRIPSLLR